MLLLSVKRRTCACAATKSINTAEATSRGFAAAPLSVIVMAREMKVVAGAGEREKKRKKKAN
jgi:hypothetical protein